MGKYQNGEDRRLLPLSPHSPGNSNIRIFTMIQRTGWHDQVSALFNRGLIECVSARFHTPREYPITLYTGIDPTADSPHIGNLLPLSVALRFLVHGHHVITLIGGATGSVGDPTGRSTDRVRLTKHQLLHNENGLTTCVQRLFQSGMRYASRRSFNQSQFGTLKIMNNKSWFNDLSMLDFLDQYGRHSRVSTMLNRDSVKSRSDSESGISFAELSYQLLQAVDFNHLYRHHNCQLQIGGSDQWGNMVAGMDLIRRLSASATPDAVDRNDDEVYGLTVPIITNSSGLKFGKSAGNAIWLDPSKTSVFDFYQFWLRTEDDQVCQYMKYFTFLNTDEIDRVMQIHSENRELRYAQKVLADEVTELVHSLDELKQAQLQTRILFSSTPSILKEGLTLDQILHSFKCDPRLVHLKWENGLTVAELFTKAGITRSISQADKLSKRGGLYINQEKIVDAKNQVVSGHHHLINNQFTILRTGKLNYNIIVFSS